MTKSKGIVADRKPRDVRFWDFVRKTKRCWHWTGAKKGNGYGQYRIGFGKGAPNGLSHRISYRLLIGVIPKGLVIDHICRNRACVNPAHMDVVTVRENILRGIGHAARNAKKKRCKRGHALVGENLIYRKGRADRDCKKCSRIREAGYREAKRQLAAKG